MPEISFKGVPIYFEEQGTGAAVVFLHGFLESSWIYRDIVPVFAKSHRVVTVDLPGHGQSGCIGYVHTMEEMAESVMAVCKHLRLRKITLIGHSMGGYVALAFGDLFPDHVKRLVLYQSTAMADPDWKKADRRRTIELVKKNAGAFVRASIPRLFRPVNRKKFSDEIRALKTEALKTPLQSIIAATEGMRLRPNRAILLTFAPYDIFIIASDKDPRIALEESLAMKAISEKNGFYLIKGCGHMSYIENFEETIKALRQAIMN